MTKLNMAEEVHAVPGLASIDAAATAKNSSYVALEQVGAGWIEFAWNFGVLTSTDVDNQVTVATNDVNDTTSTDSANVETAVAFKYRLSSAVGTDSLGTLTDATSTGVSVTKTDDNKTLFVYVDPKACGGKKYVRSEFTPATDSSVALVGCTIHFIPRYAQASNLSSS